MFKKIKKFFFCDTDDYWHTKYKKLAKRGIYEWSDKGRNLAREILDNYDEIPKCHHLKSLIENL